jgi:putative transposase
LEKEGFVSYRKTFDGLYPMTIVGMDGSVKRINKASYKVNSQSSNNSYNVNVTEIGWNCSCPDHIYRGVKCKHIYAVEISFAIRKEVES